jgi:hypothetical protein
VGGEWRTDDVILTLPFDGIRFGSRNGQRPELDVDIDVDKISFGGPLDFVRGLRQYLSFGGDDGPSVEITDEAIAVDISAELPDIKLGVFSLYDLSFSGGVELPLDGGPVLTRFGLGTPSNPFHLPCFGIGGGGYFQIATAGGELARLTLGLEAGCEVAIDFGPFSAGIGCYVGIVITLQSDGDLTFVGYFRMFGEIDLAIASASISLYIGLEYRSASGDLYGRATLVIEVTVLFFSESLEFEVERRFNSCDNDPPFRDMLDAPAWSQYCAAFGPVVHETARDGIGGPFS